MPTAAQTQRAANVTALIKAGGGGGQYDDAFGRAVASLRAPQQQANKRLKKARKKADKRDDDGGFLSQTVGALSPVLTALDVPRRGLIAGGAVIGTGIAKAVGDEQGARETWAQVDDALRGEVHGSTILDDLGMKGGWQRTVAGLAFDIGTDPLTYLAPAAALRGGAEATAARVLASSADDATKTALTAKILKGGASAADNDELVKVFGKGGGLNFTAPGTGRYGRKITGATKERQVTLLPKSVTDKINRPVAQGLRKVRDSKAGASVLDKLGGDTTQLLRQTIRTGDDEAIVRAFQVKRSAQAGRATGAHAGREFIDDYAHNVRPHGKVNDKAVIEAIETGRLEGVKGAKELKDYLVRLHAAAIERGVDINELDNYFPRIVTDEAKAAGRGVGSGYNPGAGRKIGVGENPWTVRQTMNELVPGEGEFYSSKIDRVIPKYVEALGKKVGYADTEAALGRKGLVTDVGKVLNADEEAAYKSIADRLELQAQANEGAGGLDDAVRQQEWTDAQLQYAQRQAADAPKPPQLGLPAAAADDLVRGVPAGVVDDAAAPPPGFADEVNGLREQLGSLIDSGAARSVGGGRFLYQADTVVDDATRQMAAQAVFDVQVRANNVAKMMGGKPEDYLKVTKGASIPTKGGGRQVGDLYELNVKALKEAEAKIALVDEVTPRSPIASQAPDVEHALVAGAFDEARPPFDDITPDALASELQAASDEAGRLAKESSSPENLRLAQERATFLEAAMAESDDATRLVLILEARAKKAAQLLESSKIEADNALERLSDLPHGGVDEALVKELRDAGYAFLKQSHNKMAPADVAEFMNTLQKVSTPEQLRGFFRYYDRMVNYLKAWQIATPGFHVRNDMGGIFNNFLADVDPGASMRYRRVKKFVESGGKRGRATWKEAEAYRALRPHVVRGQFDSMEVATGMPQEGLFTRVNPLSSKAAIPHYSGKAGGYVEEMLRGGMGLDAMLKGESVEDAVAKIYRYHFDYSNLSNLEKEGIKRVIPFWTWTSRNFPLQVESMVTRPSKYAWYAHLDKNLRANSPEGKTVPSYFGDIAAMPTPFNIGGNQVYTNPDLPFTRSLMEQMPIQDGKLSLDGYASQATPLLKVPIERAMNHQYFKGIPFVDRKQPMPEAWAAIPGLKSALQAMKVVDQNKKGEWVTTDRDAYTVDSLLPVLARLRRWFPSEKKFQDRALTTWLSTVGIPLRTNTPYEQKLEKYRQYFDKTEERTYRVKKK